MKRKIVVSLIIVAVLSLSQYKVLLTGYARFFTIDNATSGMEATIVVLSGMRYTRIPKALELYTAGYGKRLLLTTEQHWNSQFPQTNPTNEQQANGRSSTPKCVAIGYGFDYAGLDRAGRIRFSFSWSLGTWWGGTGWSSAPT